MEKVLDFMDIQYPITVIGFAPPYYPPVHSDMMPGREGFGSKVYEYVNQVSQRDFGREIVTENYFMGLSDLSYSGITAPFDYENFALDTPLFGESAVAEALSRIKPQPLTTVRRTIPLEQWRATGYKKGKEADVTGRWQAWTAAGARMESGKLLPVWILVFHLGIKVKLW